MSHHSRNGWIEDTIQVQYINGVILMISDIIHQQKFLSDEECQYIIDIHSSKNFERSKFKSQPLPAVNTLCQVSKETEVDTSDEQMQEIIDKITDIVKTANENYFFLDTDYSVNAYLMKFEGEEKSFITQHQKVNWLTKDKQNKIFACVNLTSGSDFDGSEHILYTFWTTIPTLPERRSKGHLMIFPSIKRSELTPILKGTRYMLFLEYTGPCWK